MKLNVDHKKKDQQGKDDLKKGKHTFDIKWLVHGVVVFIVFVRVVPGEKKVLLKKDMAHKGRAFIFYSGFYSSIY